MVWYLAFSDDSVRRNTAQLYVSWINLSCHKLSVNSGEGGGRLFGTAHIFGMVSDNCVTISNCGDTFPSSKLLDGFCIGMFFLPGTDYFTLTSSLASKMIGLILRLTFLISCKK